MLLWTVLPIELVLDGVDNSFAFDEIEYRGVKMMVEKITPVQYRIVRLISTEPQDYLCADFQPGTVLTYRPVVDIV